MNPEFKEDLKIAIVQTNLYWQDIQSNLSMLEEKIWQIEEKVDLIVLPEMFNTGFTNNTSLAEPMNLTTTKWLKMMAKQTGAAITGSILIVENNQFFNRLLWVEPSGKILKYDKRHLFRMADEHMYFSQGIEQIIIDYKGWKIKPLICYDLRFPIWARNKFDLTNHQYDYDILLYVANWPQARHQIWQTLLSARSIENLCYVIGANRIGLDGNNIMYSGGSNIFFPNGSSINNNQDNDFIIINTIEKQFLNQFRKQFPSLLDADIFQLIL